MSLREGQEENPCIEQYEQRLHQVQDLEKGEIRQMINGESSMTKKNKKIEK